MYMDKPEDGIKIAIPEGNLYFGWTFKRIREEKKDYSFFYSLHIHFSPDLNRDWVKIVFKKMKQFFPEIYVSGYPLKRILEETYHPHGDYGCINGLPFSFDSKNPAVQELIKGIEEDCDELKSRLRKFLQQIFITNG